MDVGEHRESQMPICVLIEFHQYFHNFLYLYCPFLFHTFDDGRVSIKAKSTTSATNRPSMFRNMQILG